MPDEMLLLEETEGALDPLFGVMQDAWLSPSMLAKVGGGQGRGTAGPEEAGERNQITES